MPRNLYCNVLGSSPNVQNLVSKIIAKYCKRLVSKLSCLVSVSQRQCLVSVSSRVFAQSFGLVSVSKILAETSALFKATCDQRVSGFIFCEDVPKISFFYVLKLSS